MPGCETTLRHLGTLVMVQLPHAGASPKCKMFASFSCSKEIQYQTAHEMLPQSQQHETRIMSEMFWPGEQAAAQTATGTSEICIFAWGHSSAKRNISTFPHVPRRLLEPKSVAQIQHRT